MVAQVTPAAILFRKTLRGDWNACYGDLFRKQVGFLLLYHLLNSLDLRIDGFTFLSLRRMYASTADKRTQHMDSYSTHITPLHS